MVDDKFNPELCREIHKDLNRRVMTLEEIAQKYQSRLPNWAVLLIAILSSACTGLLVALEKAGH